MNSFIIKELKELAKHELRQDDKFRAMAYSRAANVLVSYPEQITSGNDVKHLVGIGPKILSKIDEIIEKGHTSKLKGIMEQEDPKRLKVIDEFQTIHGIGPKKAIQLYDDNKIKSIKQLEQQVKKKQDLLTHDQKIGLKYRTEIQNRIPYDFIRMFQFVVAYCLDSRFGETFKIQIAGSFRRKKPDSGDIDLMLLTDAFTLEDAVEVLTSYGIILDMFGSNFNKKFMGIAHCPGSKTFPHPFRLDIFKVEKANWWPALVTHTGPKALNTDMRTKAQSLGMKLSDQGLYKGEKKINVKSEKHLFDLLGYNYIKPNDR